MTRAEHLVWAKERALACLQSGDEVSASASMMSDLRKHPELEGSAEIRGRLLTGIMLGPHRTGALQKWIEGFN